MKPVRTENAEIRGRGQLTIPKSIRDAGHFDEGRKVRVIPLGESVLVAPYRLDLEDARREARKIIAASGVSAEQLFLALAEERDALYRETYGRKKRSRLF